MYYAESFPGLQIPTKFLLNFKLVTHVICIGVRQNKNVAWLCNGKNSELSKTLGFKNIKSFKSIGKTGDLPKNLRVNYKIK